MPRVHNQRPSVNRITAQAALALNASKVEIEMLRDALRRIQQFATDTPESISREDALDAISGVCERALSDT
jgi:hypothetical protein